MNHPLLAIGIDFTTRTAASLLVALPLVSAVAATGIGDFPEGDRLLFQPGGLVLSEVARALLPALAPTLSSALATFVALGALSIVPLAAVLAVLAEPGKLDARNVGGRTLASVPALLLVTGVTLLAQFAVLALAGALGGLARKSFSGSSERLGDGLFVAFLCAGLFAGLVLGVARDLARAAAARGVRPGRAALVSGLRTFWQRPAASLLAFAPRAVAGVSLLVLAGVSTGALDVSRPEGHRFVIVALLHQAALLGVATLRVSWFASALRLVPMAPSVTHENTT